VFVPYLAKSFPEKQLTNANIEKYGFNHVRLLETLNVHTDQGEAWNGRISLEPSRTII
jgi:hypothetical protein